MRVLGACCQVLSECCERVTHHSHNTPRSATLCGDLPPPTIKKHQQTATAEIVKEMLTVLDNFERAAAAVKTETDREETINNSYQSVGKEMLKVGPLGVAVTLRFRGLGVGVAV